MIDFQGHCQSFVTELSWLEPRDLLLMVILAGYSSRTSSNVVAPQSAEWICLDEFCSTVVKTREYVLAVPLLQSFAPYHSQQGCIFLAVPLLKNTSKQALVIMSALLTDNFHLSPRGHVRHSSS